MDLMMRDMSSFVAVRSWVSASAAGTVSEATEDKAKDDKAKDSRIGCLTWWHPVIGVYRYFLLHLDVVHALEDCQPMADTDNGHLFQLFMSQRYQCLPHYFVLCMREKRLAQSLLCIGVVRRFPYPRTCHSTGVARGWKCSPHTALSSIQRWCCQEIVSLSLYCDRRW